MSHNLKRHSSNKITAPIRTGPAKAGIQKVAVAGFGVRRYQTLLEKLTRRPHFHPLIRTFAQAMVIPERSKAMPRYA